MSVDLEKLYTFAEAMEYLRASRSTVQRLIDTGKLKGGKVGGEWRFTQTQLKQAVQPMPCKQHEQAEQEEETTSQSC